MQVPLSGLKRDLTLNITPTTSVKVMEVIQKVPAIILAVIDRVISKGDTTRTTL